MLNGKTVAVVVPAFNEERQIRVVIETMPDFVDRIVVVNDCSEDRTAEAIKASMEKAPISPLEIREPSEQIEENVYNKAEIIALHLSRAERSRFAPARIANKDQRRDRIILINHIARSGLGAAMATGYRWCLDQRIDCTARMDGDGQMDPSELESICGPVIYEGIDYVKGNRLIHKSAPFLMPKLRFLGNSVLSMLTKIASGYWHISDTQTGYTAISLKALDSIPLYKIYSGYGMPNDMLVKLNMAYCTIKEVGIKPVYRVGETSKMRIGRVIPKISWLLVKSFFKRVWVKYFFRDFHPLFLLYNFGFLLGILNIPILIKMIGYVSQGRPITFQSLMVFIFFGISSFQSIFFAMWMDIQDNERLYR